VNAEGVVLETTDTLPGWAGVDIPRELARRLSVPCRADNDGNAAALAEATFGAGRGLDTVAMLTLGTGVGGGLVIGGRIFHGAGGMTATFGHLPVRPDGRRCACGARGCLEAYASAWAMRRARGGGEPDEVFRRARGGDPRARALVEAAADALGVALAQIAHAINPDVIVLGGGIARGFGALRGRAFRRYGELALARARETTAIRRARLGTAAGIVGAGLLARG
jgi:glucokinase